MNNKGGFLNKVILPILLIVIFTIAILQLTGVINIRGILNPGHGIITNNGFVGNWVTSSPAIYYSQDIDGERYVEYTANFHLNIKKEWKGYLGSGWITNPTSKAIPGAVTPIVPLVANADGNGYSSPLAFDARGYLEPQQGISSFELSGNTMIITTPLFGGKEKIVLNLVESGENSGQGDILYATLSVIPTSSGQIMGEVTDTNIRLVRQ